MSWHNSQLPSWWAQSGAARWGTALGALLDDHDAAYHEALGRALVVEGIS